MKDLIGDEAVIADRGGVAATVSFFVEVDVEIIVAAVGKSVGLNREQIDRANAVEDGSHARHHCFALGVGTPHGLAHVVATVCSVTKGSFNQKFESLAVYSFPGNDGDCDIGFHEVVDEPAWHAGIPTLVLRSFVDCCP